MSVDGDMSLVRESSLAATDPLTVWPDDDLTPPRRAGGPRLRDVARDALRSVLIALRVR